MTSELGTRNSDIVTKSSELETRKSDIVMTSSDLSVQQHSNNRQSPSLETENSVISGHVTSLQQNFNCSDSRRPDEKMSFNHFRRSQNPQQSLNMYNPEPETSIRDQQVISRQNSSFLHNSNNNDNNIGGFVNNSPEETSRNRRYLDDDYNPEVSAAFSNYQSHDPFEGVFSQSFESVDRSPKLESLEEMEKWNSYCQTPSLTEAILETDKYLVRKIRKNLEQEK
jgi:hypothetical protein